VGLRITLQVYCLTLREDALREQRKEIEPTGRSDSQKTDSTTKDTIRTQKIGRESFPLWNFVSFVVINLASLALSLWRHLWFLVAPVKRERPSGSFNWLKFRYVFRHRCSQF
jgi:hypothetical protein